MGGTLRKKRLRTAALKASCRVDLFYVELPRWLHNPQGWRIENQKKLGFVIFRFYKSILSAAEILTHLFVNKRIQQLYLMLCN